MTLPSSVSPPSMAALGGEMPMCTICYEDFKPTVEYLQSIFICGHVFHELCIQQWLEYCPTGKKPTCPVCKQKYSRKDLVRLYFQSAGDVSETQKPFLRAEAKASCVDSEKLKERISVITAAFDEQKRQIADLNEEVLLWKERTQREETLKENCKKEKVVIRQLLQSKREEHSMMSMECERLKERSLALAKELASMKLATDVNLEEEEVVKFASIGHESGRSEIIDVLKRSLVLRNKSYKELMAQCTLLGRAETRATKKLEKSEEKRKKLKARLQEVEKHLEEKDNSIIQNLKALKTAVMDCDINVQGNKHSDLSCTDIHASGIQAHAPVSVADEAHQSSFLMACNSKEKYNAPDFHDKSVLSNIENDAIAIDSDFVDCFRSNDENKVDCFPNSFSMSDRTVDYKCPTQPTKGTTFQRFDSQTNNAMGKEESKCKLFGCVINIDDDLDEIPEDAIYKQSSESAAFVDLDDGSLLPIRKLSSHESSLLGGTRPGKWCRSGQTNALSMKKASTNNGGLIVVGADGRGGKIKVLRTPDRHLDKVQHPKRHKHEAKQPGIPQGHLQIEHFFKKEII